MAEHTEREETPCGPCVRGSPLFSWRSSSPFPMPLALTPVTLQILQPSLIPVPGTDGFIHLAFAAQVTNLDRGTASFTQISPVDPLHNFAPVGESHVVDMDGNDITGM